MTCKFQGRKIYFGPHPYTTYFNQTRDICRSMSLFLLCRFQKSFWHSDVWQALETPPKIRDITSFPTSCKNHVHHNLRKSLNKWWHTWCSNVWHRCLKNDVHSLPPLFDLYTDEFEIYLDEINGDSMCLFNTMVTIPLYVDNVVLLSRSCICLKRLLTNYMRFCTSSRLEVKPTMTKIMIFGCNNRKFNQEAFYLDKDQIEITHEYDYLGIDFDLHNYFEPSDKRQGIACVKALRGTLKKKW